VYRLADAHAGLGAEAHGLVLALNLADSEGRVLVLPRRDAWCPPPPPTVAPTHVPTVQPRSSLGAFSWRVLSWGILVEKRYAVGPPVRGWGWRGLGVDRKLGVVRGEGRGVSS